ncbi:MAG TPA: helix-turn-helix domain-containing protein [Jatrophihabitans sp.]|nr:helix-turn-helix domain-containing protein [Jatrophihabitans sp.]
MKSIANRAAERLLSADVVAESLGVDAGDLQRWRSRGLGPAHLRIADAFVYRASDLEAWRNRLGVLTTAETA